MDIKKNLTVFVHLLALTGYASLSLNHNTNYFVFFTYLVLLFLSLYYDISNKKYVINSYFCNTLSVLLVLFLGFKIFIFRDELFFVLIDFIVYIQIIKFLGKKDVKDYEQIILISFFQLLAGAATTTTIVYGTMLFIYVLLSVVVIFLFNIYKDQNQTSQSKKKDPQFNYRSLLSSALVIWIGVIILTLSAFLFMPRFKGNFLSSSLLNKNSLRTGFNNEIELGRVGEIKKDNTPVMRVKFLNRKKEELPETIYWRGVALDYFDGKYWSQTDENKKKRIGKNYDGLFVLSENSRDNLAMQEIVAQPIDTDVLFSANVPMAFDDLPFRNIFSVNNSYYHNGQFTNNIRYLAYSDLKEPDSDDLSGKKSSNTLNLDLKYTIPFETTPAVKKLTEDLYLEDKSQYENVKRVERYLYSNLNYTRVLENSGDSPPLDQFLFEGRQGHCEYFATAMVVILREMSIPARIVTGFAGGEYNSIGEYYLVRESDAHAWVEVFFPGYGWVTFDPTPGNESDFYKGFNLVTGSIEYLRYRWNRYVVEFNVNDQKRILKKFSNSSSKLNFNFSSKLNTANLRNYTALIFIILFLLVIYKLSGKKLFFKNKGKNRSYATETYLKSLKLLQKKGVKKLPYMTSNEFVDFVKSKKLNVYTEFALITDIYNKVKFSGSVDEQHKSKLNEAYNKLKKSL